MRKSYFSLITYLLPMALVLITGLGALIPSNAAAKPRVVLDAAHGGNDPGSMAGSQIEKEWNAKIVRALEKAMESEGFEVVLIRKGDETIPEDKRVEMANTSQASAVIIVHAEREWTGTQTGPLAVVEPPNRMGVHTRGAPSLCPIKATQY